MFYHQTEDILSLYSPSLSKYSNPAHRLCLEPIRGRPLIILGGGAVEIVKKYKVWTTVEPWLKTTLIRSSKKNSNQRVLKKIQQEELRKKISSMKISTAPQMINGRPLRWQD